MSKRVRTTTRSVIQLCLCIIPTEAVTLHVAFSLVNMLCHVNTQSTCPPVFMDYFCVRATVYIFVTDLSQATVRVSRGGGDCVI